MNELHDLENTLNECGKNPLLLNESILVLPFGGRVLGLFPDSNTNVFWVNDALKDPAAARTYFNESGWLNTGGDRTWISPEGETHVPDLSRYPESIEVPGSVDPVLYEIVHADSESISIGADMRVRFHQSGVDVPLRVEKTVTVLDGSPVALPEGVQFSGYRSDTSLHVEGTVDAGARPGIWSLLQVPGGGEILCPVHPGARPTAFFNDPAYEQTGELITASVETDASYKFSMKAKDSTGKLLYRKMNGDRSILIVRNFTVADQSWYADFPCSNPLDDGYLTEIYIDDGGLGGFGEMEYHSPAVELRRGEQAVEDSSETWGYVGSEDAIAGLAETFVETAGR